MWWTIAGIACIAVGALLIYSVMVKKFPQLKLIDLSTLAKERHAQTKSRIIQQRFERSLSGVRGRMAQMRETMAKRMGGFYRGAYGRLKQMEKNLEDQKPLTVVQQEDRIATVLAEAEQHARNSDYQKAEAGYIETLRLDPKRLDAYRGLADVYISQRLYEQARETLEFLVRLNAVDDRAFERLAAVAALSGDYAEAEAELLKAIAAAASPAQYRVELGEVYLTTGEHRKAHEQFRLALEVEPYNPKYLDYFLEASILTGDLNSAEQAFEVLETANPENQKLADFRDRIETLRQPEAA